MQRVVLAACAISAAMISFACAQEQFVGRWAMKPGLCSVHGGETPETSALVATDTSLWWFDGQCRIGKMYKAVAVYVQAHCDGKGDVSVTLDARGNRMRVTWGHAKPQDLMRCN
jgi:hypothetical protein